MRSSAVEFARFEDRASICVFIVSPNAKLRQDIQQKLDSPRWKVIEANGGAEALGILGEHGGEGGVLLLDPTLPDLDPAEFSVIVRDRFPETQILTLNSHTGQLLIGTASPTPISKKLVDTVNRNGFTAQSASISPATETLASFSEAKQKLRNVVGDSEQMQRIYALTRMVASRATTVLITGESGTGKDLIAQEIHLISPRRNQPLVVVNCSAIPETLLEAELFGYTKGAFTGAVQARIGRIHAAHGGTLFLDEIGDMPLSLQSKILRFLEQGEVQRIGGNDNLRVDVRVIAATNADLKERVARQQFREDLYYRLAVFPIHLPPLRQRMSDLNALVRNFAAKLAPGVSVTSEALQVLEQHTWPGNIRELRNAIERAIILAAPGNEISAEHVLL
jgi:transcriptional regulator with GAF, ATPase, and Fis domain